MSNTLSLAAKLSLDTQRWLQGLNKAGGGMKGFVSSTKQHLASLKSSFGSVQGQLASLGVTVGATALIVQSAKMDKSLTQIGQTAGASKQEVLGLRKELFAMGSQTGQNVDDLQSGFNILIQSGLTWKESLAVIGATNKTMAVTGAQAETLAGALGVASTAFNYDLSKPGQALTLLDKMTVAGRKGNAELQDLSSIVSRVGVNAAGAGFGFDKTLAFVEGLSQIERQPERLATLADSTLRLFTNAKYMEASQKATGVSFFDKKTGSRNDPIEVLSNIKKKYDALKNDSQRQNFLTKAFGQADLDTIKGLKTLLSGNTLSNIKTFTSDIGNAGGTISRDLPSAVKNAVDQAGRLKAVLRESADGFAKPINEAIASTAGKLINKKSDGGMELNGTNLAVGAGGLVIAGLLAKKFGGKLGSSLLGKLGGTAAGVAEGKALEAAAGITPVFVTNMPAGGIGGSLADAIPGAAKKGLGARALSLLSKGKGLLAAGLGSLGLGSLAGLGTTSVGALAGAGAYGGAALAGGVGIAGAAGYGVGTLAYNKGIAGTDFGDKIGSGIAKTLAFFGNKEAGEAVKRMEKAAQFEGALKIDINSQGMPIVKQSSSSNSRIPLTVNTGRMMAGGAR